MTAVARLSFPLRAEKHKIPIAQRLLELIETKQSHLCLSADVQTTKELLSLADDLGPYIVVLKTHIDIVSDFNEDAVKGLVALSEKHNFLIFEDRKFVDIGNTARMQYNGGILRISEWAHIVNVCVLSGDGTIRAIDAEIKALNMENDRGILMLGDMTTKESFKTNHVCVEYAARFPTTLVGFVSKYRLVGLSDAMPWAPDYITFTTGVNRSDSGDAMDQQYQTPKQAIKAGSDVIIVGRGIYRAADPVEEAKAYRKEAWDAYQAVIRASTNGEAGPAYFLTRA